GQSPADPDRENGRLRRIRHRIPALPHPENASLPEFVADVTVQVPEAEQVTAAQEHPVAAYRSTDTVHASTLRHQSWSEPRHRRICELLPRRVTCGGASAGGRTENEGV